MVEGGRADVRRGDWIDPRLARRSFASWAEQYLATLVHLRSVTRADYELALRNHILPTFADSPIAQIEQVDVRRLLADRQAAGLGPKSLQRIRLVLRQVLELARASGALKANACDGIRLPRAPQREPVFLTAEEAERLARATTAPYDVLVRLAVVTGMRPSELCGLKVGRVHLLRSRVEVVEALTVVHGRTEMGPIKNGVRRTVTITAEVRDELGAHLDHRAAELGRPLEPDDLVFVAPRGGPLRRDLLHKRFIQPAAVAAGLPPMLRVHDLRHTCASLLIALGAHPKVIQEVLGHRSITVTMDVYGHLFPSLNAELNGRLNALLVEARSTAEQHGEALVLPFAR